MQKSTLPGGGAAALILAGLASCSPPSNEKAIPPLSKQLAAVTLSPEFFTEIRTGIFFPKAVILNHALSIAPLKERFIARCPATLPSAARVVKLRVGHNTLRIKQLERKIVGKNHSGGGAQTIAEPPLTGESTPFDMVLDSPTYGAGSNFVALKVILSDPDIKFPSDDHSITTVYEVNENEPTIFKCLDMVRHGEDVNDNQSENSTHGGAPQYDYAIVYIDRSVKKTQKFNIRIVVPQQNTPYVMPVILDPNIKNNG